MTRTRTLAVVFGDQLNHDSALFDGFDAVCDRVLMMEVAHEATYVPQHAQRLVLFFSAMRHHAAEAEEQGRPVDYVRLDDPGNTGTFEGEIARAVARHRPERIAAVLPGDWRVARLLEKAAEEAGLPLDILPDRHFLSTPEEFAAWAEGRRELVLEYWYRHLRRRDAILMDGDAPVGGAWNFDAENRESFGKSGPPEVPNLRRFCPDAVTREVMDMVARRFPDAPGDLDGFDWPVTHAEALVAARDFFDRRLAHFGRYQDAMAAGEPFLWHSRLSAALNLHLLDPRHLVARAVAAHDAGEAPLNAVEGFIRQIVGWREYVRGVYWLKMPGYGEMNALGADLPAPAVLWTGETEMACLADAVGQLKRHAYAHHIQRLMVLGLFGQLLGVDPYEMHRWHLSMYADAVDWVSLPNVLGMSQFGDGGIVGTKPYCASGRYIDRMSDHCRSCRYDPGKATGADACPMTTLYWDFLDRHAQRFRANRRMAMQLKNLDRKAPGELEEIRARAARLRARAGESAWLPPRA
ncbi:MAG: cryptochrome/photolyase family protein [Alphaproteobacteria bacterium]|nr:cryptochrome/photolyase family protein [Alphaproteobacteria bacterium]MDX5368288.1 cryptochrome/photolyase family protein [Alphaproteobacteria bacterium]MDX5463094.1 cryptochrome/photolyase family protein [Alphaproteobacteria bacterium]